MSLVNYAVDMPIDLSKFLVFYVVWHYSRALHDFLALWENAFRMMVHFFSIPLLLKTFFSPFHRLTETPPRGFHPGDFIAAKAVTLIMRFVGIFLRTFLIVAGVFSLVVVALGGAVLFVGWLLLPVLIAALFILGFFFLFS